MTIEDFIKSLAAGIKDPSFIVMDIYSWKEIINFQAGELFPEIGYRGSNEVATPSASTDYQLDLSGSTYANLEDVKEIYLKDSDGNYFLYENWIYEKDLEVLDLDPTTSKQANLDPADYDYVKIIWSGYMGTLSLDTDNIDLSPPKLALLKKICIKEAIRRILLDHTKLDRYRTLVGRTNEYALLAMIRDLTTEIEISKRRLIDTHQVRTF